MLRSTFASLSGAMPTGTVIVQSDAVPALGGSKNREQRVEYPSRVSSAALAADARGSSAARRVALCL
jgi:hypothetical protein